jgi:hypothetical protein
VPRNTSRKALALERESRVWALRCRGWTQERVAAELGIDQGTVSRIERKCWEKVRAAHEAELAMQRAIALGQIEFVIDESGQAWGRSKLPRKRASRRTATDGQGGADGDGKGAEVSTVESIEQTGDPAYLDRFMAGWDRKNKLLGLDAPPKLAVEDEGQPGSVSSIAATLAASDKAFDELIAGDEANETTTDDVGEAPDGGPPETEGSDDDRR